MPPKPKDDEPRMPVRKVNRWDSVATSPGAPGVPIKEMVTVKLLAGKGLKLPEGNTDTNTFVTLTVSSDKRNEYTSKTVAHSEGNPEWGDVDTPLVLVKGAKMPVGFAEDPFLRLTVYSVGTKKDSKPSVLGRAKIPFAECEAGLVHDKWQPLIKCKGSPAEPSGELRCFVKLGRAESFMLPKATEEAWVTEKEEKAAAKKAALEKKRQAAAEKELLNEAATNKNERAKNELVATKVADLKAKDAQKGQVKGADGKAKGTEKTSASKLGAGKAGKASTAADAKKAASQKAKAGGAGGSGAKVLMAATLKDATVDSFDDVAQKQFIEALAASLGVDASQIKVAGVRPGSLVVDVEISGLEDEAAAKSVAAAAEDPATQAHLAVGLEEAGLGGVELSPPTTVTEDADPETLAKSAEEKSKDAEAAEKNVKTAQEKREKAEKALVEKQKEKEQKGEKPKAKKDEKKGGAAKGQESEKAAKDSKTKEEENAAKKKEAEELKLKKEKQMKEKEAEREKQKKEKEAAKAAAAETKKEKAKEKEKAAAAKAQEKAKKEQANKEKPKDEPKEKKVAAKKEQKKQNSAARSQQRAAKKEQKAAASAKSQEEDYYFDEELGRKVKKINDRSKVEDTCYQKPGFKGCMAYGFIMMFLGFPLLYGAALGVEYKNHGWDRVIARSAGHAYGSTTHSFLDTTGLETDADGNVIMPKDFKLKDSQPKEPKAKLSPKPAPAPAPKPEPKPEAKAEPAPAPKPEPKEPKAEKSKPEPKPKVAPNKKLDAAAEEPKPAASAAKHREKLIRSLEEEITPESEGSSAEDEPEGKSQAFLGFAKKNPLCWILPCIGLFLGLFANIVPGGFGLMLMPLFEKLGVTHHSDGTVALICLIAFVNNGVLGFTTWCCRDVRFFICRGLWLLTPCIWIGYFVGVTHHLSMKDIFLDIYDGTEDPAVKEDWEEMEINMLHTYIRLGLGCFMVFMSIWVLIGVCIGGVNRYCCPSFTGGTTPGGKSFCQWIIVIFCCINTGWMFVATIGCGSGIMSFFLLSFFLGVETKRALPTAIVISGWVAILPAARCILFADTMPYVTLLMMFPGLWAGSFLAPWFSKCGGPMCDLFIFFLVLCSIGTAVVALAAIAINGDKEDVDIDISPAIDIGILNSVYDQTTGAAVAESTEAE